jgi:RNA recognition motif-containing protein
LQKDLIAIRVPDADMPILLSGDFIIPKNTNKKSGGACGYAFVDMSTSSEAERAIVKLPCKEIGDRKVYVELARDKSGAKD